MGNKEQHAIARGSGRWGDPAVPKTGWQFEGETDHGKRDFICEMCGYMEIRYEHSMSHPQYPEMLGCGCVCAGHMSGDMATAEARRRDAVNTTKRAQSKAKRDRLNQARLAQATAEARQRLQHEATRRAEQEASQARLTAEWEAGAPAREAARLLQAEAQAQQRQWLADTNTAQPVDPTLNTMRHSLAAIREAMEKAKYGWRQAQSGSGNWWRPAPDGWRLTVYQDRKFGGWKFMFSLEDAPVWHNGRFDDEDDAMQEADEQFAALIKRT